VGGKKEKFQEQATKEEKEWLSAVQQELVAKRGLEQLKLNLDDAERAQVEFLDIASIRNQCQLELDEIYNQVFDGPTPDVPEEDEKEGAVRKAENDFNIVQLLLSTEKQTVEILWDAQKFLIRAIDDLRQALETRNDASANLRTVSEIAESSTLGRAQSNVWQVEMFLNQAHRVQPEVGHVGEMDITQEDFLSDILFDNIISDLTMRKVRNCQYKLIEAQGKLTALINAAGERQKRVQSDLDQTRIVLDGRRRELQLIRTATFNRLLGEVSAHMDAPPSYEAEPPSYTVRV
jgi:hypothetical protein